MERIECPICGGLFPQSVISMHADRCLDETDVDDEELTSDASLSSDCKRARIDYATDLTSSPPRCSNPAVCDLAVPFLNSEGKSVSGVPLTDCVSLSETSALNVQSAGECSSGNRTLAQNMQSTSTCASLVQTSKRSRKSANLMDFFTGSQKSVQLKENKLSRASVKPTTTHPSTTQQDVQLMNLSKESLQTNCPQNVSDTVLHTSSATTAVKSSAAAVSHSSVLKPSTQPSALVTSVPLAERMRPTVLADFVGQGHIVGSQRPLRLLLESASVSSMILWGPPGCGKTTLAKIVAQKCRMSTTMRFVTMSATMAGVADVKDAVKCAKNEQMFGRRTVLFIDEIHRFNKLQQDTFLPHVESGTIILVGATTENPSFHVNSALLSRCQVVVLEKLSVDNLRIIVDRALQQLGITKLASAAEATDTIEDGQMLIDSEAVESLVGLSDGDARCALNGLEFVINAKLVADPGCNNKHIITDSDVRNGLVRSHIVYDRLGEEHYNSISALHKSIRGSDDSATMYWLVRMIEGGEDPLFIARRLIVCASEDIGLADVHALPLAVSTYQACHFIGLPECAENLAHCVTYLSRARKSNEAYVALCNARTAIRQHRGPQPGVPIHLRNATTQLAHRMGYGADYKYNHDFDAVDQTYLPEELLGSNFFKPSPCLPSTN